MSEPIYMISNTGATKFRADDLTAGQVMRVLEAQGFHRCTRDEFRKQRRWQQRQDAQMAAGRQPVVGGGYYGLLQLWPTGDRVVR